MAAGQSKSNSHPQQRAAGAGRAVFLVAALLSPSQADAGDATAGRELAEKWCANCHLIGPANHGSDTAPPFTAIAADPLNTRDDLQTWLATPHTEMPAMPLSRRDIDDIIDYIGTLAN